MGSARETAVADAELDTKGLKCPLPVLGARKAMKPLAAGQVLLVEATDPSSVQDFKNFCETTGHELLAAREEAGVYIYEIRKV